MKRKLVHHHKVKFKSSNKTQVKTLPLYWGFTYAVSWYNFGLIDSAHVPTGTPTTTATETASSIEGAYAKLLTFVAGFNAANYFPLAQYLEIATQPEGPGSTWYTATGPQSYARCRIWTCRRKIWSTSYGGSWVSDLAGYVAVYTYMQNSSGEFIAV